MRIKINDIEFAYDVLCNSYLLRDSDRKMESKLDQEIRQSLTEGDESVEDLEKLKQLCGISYGPIEMPYPFDFADFHAKRVLDHYSAFVILGARDIDVFRNSSTRIKSTLREGLPNSEIKLEFLSSTPHGSGYIKNDKGIVYAIVESGESRRIICIGRGGAVQQSFFGDNTDENKQRFIEGILRLENITNFLINDCWYSSFIDPRSHNYSAFEIIPDELTLHINCV